MVNRYIFLISIIILLTLSVNGQYILDQSSGDFESLTVEHGLSHNTVYCLLKDKSGFLWFGTEDGLSRYNSYDISIVKSKQEKSGLVDGVSVYDLYEDKAGYIWIATSSGLNIYDPTTETVSNLPIAIKSNTAFRINCIEAENDNVLWLGTSEGLILYHKTNGIIEHYKHSASNTNSLSNSIVTALAKKGDILWVASVMGLNRFDITSKNFNYFFHEEDNNNTIPSNAITTLVFDHQDNLWIGTEQKGITCLQKESKNFITYNTTTSDLPNNQIRDFSLSSSGDLWIATNGGGLSKRDATDGSFETFDQNPANPKDILTNSVYSVLEDNEGILWVGTYAAGVCFNTSKNDVFKVIRHQAKNENSVCENRMRSLYLDSKANLWIGTWGGLSVYNQEKRSYTSYIHDKDIPSSISFNTVTSLFEDSDGSIWVGTYSGGLNLLNKDKKGFTHFKHDPKDQYSLSDDNVYCITEDGNGNLWIGTLSGLNLYNPDKGNFTRFNTWSIRDMQVTKENNLVIATAGGILFFNTSTATFEHFGHSALAPFPIGKILLEPNDKTVWFCSLGGGMGYLDIERRKFTLFTEKNGLSSNYVSSIVAYDKNTFWISTFKGLSLFNKSTKAFKSFGLNEKLPCYQFQPRASAILPDGHIGFGGSKGLVVFHPDSVSNYKVNPKIVLSSLKVDNKIVEVNAPNSPLKKSISKTDALYLDFRQNDFSFDFAALNFNNPGTNQYAYKLDGYMEEWVHIDNARSVGFTNLNQGEYTLKIKTLNNSSSNYVKSLSIVIFPPFYATWWFKALAILAFAILVFYYKKYTLISIKQKNNLALQRLKLKSDEEFSQMRLKFFTYISHELRTPLTLIADPLHQLMEVKNDAKDTRLLTLIDKSVSRLLRLIDQVLDINKFEGDVISLQVSQQDIVKRLEEIVGAFYEFAFQKEISFKFHTEIKTLQGWVDEDKIEKIMYNLLSNALKFTHEKGEVIVTLEHSDNHVIIHVKDNGVGIPKNEFSKIFDGFHQVNSAHSSNSVGNGIGLAYVKRLVGLHHASITLDSTLGKGTTFKVTIPINKVDYKADEIAHKDIPATIPPVTADNENDTKISLKQHTKDTPRILVVDDEADIRNYLAAFLSRKFRILQAANGKEALAMTLKYRPDLVLSDTLMPVMDGIELCQEIKKNEKISYIPFLFLSAWTSDNFKLRGLEIGANDYIQKPFNFKILESKIISIIENGVKLSELSMTRVNIIPEDKNIDSFDTQFIKKTQEVLAKHFDNPDFNAYSFKEEMSMSHSVLYRKLKQLTGKSSNEFIRSYRLKRSTQIIKQNSGLLIAEICIKSGFNDPKYFSQCFKRKYNLTPSEYAAKYADDKASTIQVP